MRNESFTAINYVLACWSGLRRVNPPEYVTDRSVFLKKHLESLVALRHNLAQITLVINHNPEEPPEYAKFIDSLPNHLNDVPLQVIRRSNRGFSYGGYSTAYAVTKAKQFTHYMLMEDDYVFCLNNFDDIMVNLQEDNPNCGFLTFWLAEGSIPWITRRIRKLNLPGPKTKAILHRAKKFCPERFVYARITLGLLKADAAAKMWERFKCLPHATGTTHDECKIGGQFCLPAGVQQVGFDVCDAIPNYNLTAYSPTGGIVQYGPRNTPKLIAAVQELMEIQRDQEHTALQGPDVTDSTGPS